MSNAKHTPGPWTVNGYAGPSCRVIGIAPPRDRSLFLLAHVIDWPVPDENGNVSGPTPEAAANAHLIASAPELLEALESLVDIGERMSSGALESPEQWFAARALAKAVIAKATGKAVE